MEIILEIPAYHSRDGLRNTWIDGFEIQVRYERNQVFIVANSEGVLSLAGHFATLAQKEVPSSRHFHLSESSGLEPGSVDLVIGKR
jgi:hypothetical protein